MAVRIRLKRVGRRHRPSYRICAVDRRRARDSRVIEELGFYDPVHPDSSRRFSVKRERINYWVSVGAELSDTVRRIVERSEEAAGSCSAQVQPDDAY